MKNLFTNLMKNTAKSFQNTGGGTSLEKNSAVAVWNDSRTTVNRRSTDGQSQRQYSLGMMKYAAMITLLLTLACGNVWGDDYTETYSNPTGTNPPARANGMGAFTTITPDGTKVTFGNSSLQIGTASASGTFTISSTDGSYITGITFTQNGSYPVGTLTSSDGTVTGPSTNVYTFTPSTSTKTSCSFSMTASASKTRIPTIVVSLSSNYEYFSKNFSISSGTVSCTKSNGSSDITITSTGGTSNNGLTLANTKALTIASSGHNIKAIHFTCESHNTMSNLSANTGTYSSNSWTKGESTNSVTFTSSGSNATIVGISVELESAGGGCTSITPTWSTDYSSTTLNVGATSSTPVVGKDGSSGAVTFSSSGTDIATVNSSGVVTGVGAGTATITATVAADGGKCAGTVTKEFTIKAGVTYDANSATGGSVPTDDNTYAYNADITVAGNTGSLYKTGKVFNGWNTRSDGTGTHYEAGATMKMPSKSAGVTLYAEWVGYATSWEWWNSGQSNNSTTFTYLTNKNYICSFKSSASTAVASWDITGTIVYRGVKMKTKDHYMYFWVPTGKRVSITFGYMSTKPTFTVGGVNKADDLTTSTTDSATVTYTTTADTKFYIENETATNTAFTVKSVEIEDYAPACSAPAAPSISGTTNYTAGNTITLTATCASDADASTMYTWYKGADWATASAASAVQAAAPGSSGYTFTKSAVVADAGKYWCEASNGSGCEAHNTTGYLITVTCATAPVAVTSLTCSEQTTSSLTYTWTKASNASGYVATLYPDEDCEDTPVATETLGDVATVSFTSLSASTTYYCKVQSMGNGTVYCENGGTTSAVSGTTSDPTYTVSATVNPAGYGSLSATSISSIVSGTEISTLDNVLTVDKSSITATAADATTQYSYAFDSWTKSDGMTLPSTVTGDLAVRANFTRTGKSYTITLNDQGATNTPTGSVSATFGSAMPAIATLPTKTSYTLGGFYSAVGGGGTCYYNSSGESQQNSDFEAAGTLYAKWTQSITLDDESATTAVSPSSVTVTYNSSTIASITNPQKTGYSFGGWYTGDNGTGTLVINTSGVLQANVDGYTGAGGVWTSASARTLYAKWYPIETYTFNYSNSKSISTLKGEGWTFNSESTTSISADGAFVNLVKTFTENSITTPGTDGSGNDYSLAFAKSTSAYARFDLGQTTTVTSLTGSMKVGTNGSSTAWKSITIKFLGSDGSTVKATYTKDHTTASWTSDALSYTTSVADVKYIQIQGGNKWQILDNLTIKYVNTLVKYDVTYKANGGTGDDIEHNVATVEACTFTAPSNKHFTGWNTDAEGEGTAYAVGASVPSNLTLYAQWAWDTYTISFAAAPAGAGTVSSSSIASVEYGSEISINGSTQVLTLNETDITPTPADATAEYTYSLGTWNVTDGDEVSGTATYTHTFTRTANNYTLAWDKNGSGDALSGTYDSGTTAFNSSITAPNDPTWSGYRFDGWNSKDDGSGDDSTGKMPAANTTYYAQWTALYSVTHTLTGCTATSGDTGSGAAANGEAYEAVFSPSVGYTTPATVSVTIGGNDATVDEDYTWTEGTGTLSIAAASVTGAIVITVEYTEDNTERTVTYDANEADSGDVPTEDDHKAGDTFELAGNTGTLVKDGYTFRGWTCGDYFYKAGDTFTMPAEAVTLTAVWDAGESCTEYEVLLSDASIARESSTAPKGDYITGRGLIMYNSTGSSTATLNTGQTACHSSTTNFQTSGSKFAVRTYNAINRLVVYGVPTGSNRTISSIKTATATNSYSSDIKSTCKLNENLNTSGECGETTISFPNTLAANTFVEITFSSNVKIHGVDFENCVDYNFDVTFANQTGFDGTTTLPSKKEGVATGKKIVKPADPEAEHYTFDGWYSNAACTAGNEINWNTMTITADKTIYAKWLADTRIITQPQTSIDGTKDVAYTLGTGMVVAGENLEYQWYSCDENGENLVVLDGETSSTMSDTKTSTGTYYYMVKVMGTYGSPKYEYSDKITVTVKIAISPSLSYSPTTLYAFGGTPREAQPTLTGNTDNGTVTYSSSKTSVVSVNASTGVIAAVSAGTATITATIAATTDYKGGTATCNITVPALVQQTIRVGTSTSWNGDGSAAPDMTFPGDPTSTTSQVAVVANSGYTFDATTNSDKASMTKAFTGTETTKNSSKYITLKFKNETHAIKLGEVVVPIQPINSDGKAQVEIYEGSTLKLTSSEKTGIKQGKLTNVKFTFASSYTFAANENIEVRIFFYGQTDGFRLGTPITINGGVMEAQKLTKAGNWSDPANWNGGVAPTIDYDVIVEKELTVDVAHAMAKSIILDQSGDGKAGKLTIQANKGLEVAGTVQVYNGSSYGPTTPADLVLESSADGNASLIFNNNNECQATVQMYSKSVIANENTWNWQYIGSPYVSASALHNYYGCYLKKWGDPAVGWNDVASGASIEPWKAYSITQESTSTFVMEGTLVPTDNSVELDIPAKPSWIIANSWTAPIYIDDMDDAFDEETEKTVYLFNTGFAPSGTSMATTGSEESRYAAGTYLSVPVNSAVSIGNPFISSMQGFVVKNTTSPRKAIKLTLDYATMVRPTADRGIAGGPMHAPKRVKENEENPNVLKMLARGRNYDDCLFFLERPDFTTGFDNGWDGSKLGDNAVAPRLYTTRDDGTKESVSAVPELEGSIVTFRAGEDNEYTFHFEYNEEAETLYLLDMDKNIYTRVLTGNTYTFITSDKVEHPRFMLTRYNAPAITTGVDEAQKAGSARKQMINGTLYIIRDGRIYNAEGALVK